MLITVPVTENYLPISSFSSGANGQNCQGVLRGIEFTPTMSFETGMAWRNVGKLHQGCIIKQLDVTHYDNSLEMKNANVEHHSTACRASLNMKTVCCHRLY